MLVEVIQPVIKRCNGSSNLTGYMKYIHKVKIGFWFITLIFSTKILKTTHKTIAMDEFMLMEAYT